MNTSEKYIITGGPGSGKTSLLQALFEAGYNCSEEASRRLITELVAAGSDCLPWTNLSCFAIKALDRMIDLYNQTADDYNMTFFDRGIPDIIAYLKAARLPVPDRFYTALRKYPYQKTVFILPPWQAIYVNDAERWQTFEESVHLYTNLRETYQSLGFVMADVPAESIEGRMKYILEVIRQQREMPKDLELWP